MVESEEIFVYIALGEKDHLVGRLWCHSRNGRESASFEYDETWLKNPEKFALEPALSLDEGSFHTQLDQALFGVLGDSAPDRWGRVLMRRAETQRARAIEERPRTLREIDYLLGVSDQTRQGALRFARNLGGPFLRVDDGRSIPPLLDLPRLLSASELFLEDNESAEDLRLLLAPGSSLGGARPKASVRDKDGSLAIAKFPRKDDEYNVVLWEAVALTLAKKAGINVSEWRLEQILDKPVLILKRFDRQQEQRVAFLSAMSMLGAKDNQQRSYIEICYALAQYGAKPNLDMHELWRRMVFNILISNTDDHLRNHGFVYERHQGWRLSPAYDLNPTPIQIKPRVLSTAINFEDCTGSLETAFSVIDEFRLSKKEAESILSDLTEAISSWRKIAKSFGLKKSELDWMASAFEY